MIGLISCRADNLTHNRSHRNDETPYFLICCGNVSAFHVEGVNPTNFRSGEEVVLKVK